MNTKKKKEYIVKGIIAAGIVAIVLFFAVNRYNELSSPVKEIEGLLNEGVESCNDGGFDKGIATIQKAITLAHRKSQHESDKELKEKLVNMEADALLLKGIFALKKVQDKYGKERYLAVLNNQTFKLPAEELTEAEESFKAAIALKPIMAEAYRLLGYIYREKGQYLKAIETLEQAIEHRENFAEALNDLGESYYMTKQYDKAREFYEKAIIADDKLASAHLNLGMFYFFENQAQKSEKSQQKAAKHLLEFIKLGEESGYKEDVIKAQEYLAELAKKQATSAGK